MSRIEVWAVDESRVEVMSEHPRRWSLLLVAGIGWVLFAVLLLTYHVETLAALAVFTGITFIAGGATEIATASTFERGRRWPTVALGLTKWLLHEGAQAPLDAQLANEAFALELSSRSEDFREGLAAFREKRDPRFGGR